MTVLAKDVINRARYTLSDKSRDRWTDERLLILLNDGMRDIAKRTTLFVETTFYKVQNNIVDIDLSSISTKIVRAEYLDEPLPIYSFEEMDTKKRNWQLDKGDKVKALVIDKQRNGLYKQYPIVENAFNDMIVFNSPYGMVTDITYSDIAPVLIDNYGDIGTIPNEALIKFYYVRKHAKVYDINDVLHIDDLVEQPLASYIAGMALRDNQDAQNRGMANEELSLYSAMVENYSMEKMENFARTNRATSYNPMGV